jgi:sulfide:quinone oxidoreductase
MIARVNARILVLGAGFGGLELAATMSAELGAEAGVVVIDKSHAFVFGYSKLDVMFGRTSPESVRLDYARVDMPGVQLLRETIVAIDPEARSVTTDAGVHEGEHLVVALGADYDLDATPGLAGSTEFYSTSGADRLAELLPEFTGGHAVVGVCGAPFKCPPAPSEAVFLLHEYLAKRGIRDRSRISLVMPFGTPIPPSPDSSRAVLAACADRGIEFVPGRRVASVDAGRGVASLDDDSELPFDLMLAVPRHRAPEVVIASGMTEDGYVPIDRRTLETRFPGVYALGDVATVGVPKAGVFAEAQAQVVARNLLARVRGGEPSERYDGIGSCFIEWGDGVAGRVNVDFFSGDKPTGTFDAPSAQLIADKAAFGAARRARWFGIGS